MPAFNRQSGQFQDGVLDTNDLNAFCAWLQRGWGLDIAGVQRWVGANALTLGASIGIYNDNNPGLAQNYLGQPTYPSDNVLAVRGGHAVMAGRTYGWGANASILTIMANSGKDPSLMSDGSMGGFYDLNYRKNYAGTDSNALSINNRQPAVLATVTNAVFGGTTAGAFTLTCTPALSATVLSQLRKGMWVITNNGFQGAVIGWDQGGSTLIIDAWSRGAGNFFHGSVVPGDQGKRPSDYDSGPYTAWVHCQQLVSTIYGGTMVQDQPYGNVTLAGIEWAMINNTTTLPTWSDTDPLGDKPVVGYGYLIGGLTDSGTGVGILPNGFVTTDNVLRSYVAQSGIKYAFACMELAPGKIGSGFFSNQTAGQVLLHKRKDGSANQVLIDVTGNAVLAGQVNAAAFTVNAGVTSGTILSHAPGGITRFLVDATGDMYLSGNLTLDGVVHTVTLDPGVTSGSIIKHAPGGTTRFGVDALGNLTAVGTATVGAASVASGVELGSLGTAGMPTFDFHSSGGAARDYDARISASGGSTSVDGQATLTLNALITKITGTLTGPSAVGDKTIAYIRNGDGAVMLGNGTVIASANFVVQGGLSVAQSTPASSAAAGGAGSIAVDASYIYVCTAANTWKRTALSTF